MIGQNCNAQGIKAVIGRDPKKLLENLSTDGPGCNKCKSNLFNGILFWISAALSKVFDSYSERKIIKQKFLSFPAYWFSQIYFKI